MSAPYPVIVPEAFAKDASGTYRNAIPQATGDTQRASWSLGFPPLTMTPKEAGGKPMLGPDMNGALYALSSHVVYQQTGKPYSYNADVVVALGGYDVGVLLGSIDGSTIWFNIAPNNTTDPDSGVADGWAVQYAYGFSVLPAFVGGIQVLTNAQASKSVIVVNGALVANLQVILPKQYRRWLIVNVTTGAFAVTVRTSTGAGVNVAPGGFAAPTEVYGDTVNIYNIVAPVALPLDIAPNPNTIAQRSNNGYLYATYFNMSGARGNFVVENAIADNGDGFLRRIPLGFFEQQLLLQGLGGAITNLQLPLGPVIQYVAQILDNAALTGATSAPDSAVGDSTNRVANTRFASGLFEGDQTAWSMRLPGGLTIKGGQVLFGNLNAGFGTNVQAVAYARPFTVWGFPFALGKLGNSTAAVPFARFPNVNGFQLGMEEWTGVNQGPDNTATYICVGI